MTPSPKALWNTRSPACQEQDASAEEGGACRALIFCFATARTGDAVHCPELPADANEEAKPFSSLRDVSYESGRAYWR